MWKVHLEKCLTDFDRELLKMIAADFLSPTLLVIALSLSDI